MPQRKRGAGARHDDPKRERELETVRLVNDALDHKPVRNQRAAPQTPSLNVWQLTRAPRLPRRPTC